MKRFFHDIKVPEKYPHKINRLLLIANLISALLLMLFIYTALSKLNEYETFRFVLGKSPLLHPFAGIIAVALPIAEIIIALLLFLPTTRLKGLYASFMLISLFTAYLIYMITLSPDLPCSCGGVIQSLTWPQHIIFNLCLILLSGLAIFLYNRDHNRRSSPPP